MTYNGGTYVCTTAHTSGATFDGTTWMQVAAPGAQGPAGAAPSGQVGYFAAITPPVGWLKANGAAISRTTYAALFAAMTTALTGATTSGQATISGLASTAGLSVGYSVSGPGISSGATIASIASSTSITISSNATATASGVALISSPFGLGDGSTSFNVPDLRGQFIRSWVDNGSVDSGRSFGSAQADMVGPHTHGFTGAGADASGTVTDVNGSGAGSPYNAFVMGAASSAGSFAVAQSTGTETRPRNVSLLACVKF